MRIFWKKLILVLPALIFQWVFISRSCFESDNFIAYSNEWDWREKTMFIHTHQTLITSFYIKKVPIFSQLAMSQPWSAIFWAMGVWGGKLIGRVRVKVEYFGSAGFEFWKWNFGETLKCAEITCVGNSCPLTDGKARSLFSTSGISLSILNDTYKDSVTGSFS